jgi:transmembrane sensor
MARSPSATGRTGAIDNEAAKWFAAMHGPNREASRAEFERWRDASPAHRAAYDEAERLWQLSTGLAGTEIGAARRLPGRRPPFWSMPAARPAFAALAVVLIAVIAIGLWRANGARPGSELVATAEPVSTRIGEIRLVRLADGSAVTLDTDSAIEITMSADKRLVRLTRGRARFDVAHDAARPFLVEAGGRSVTALGTVFDVGIDPNGMSVTLFRGSVDVRGLAQAGSAAPLTRLAPGECYSDAPRRPRVAKAPAGAERWVSGMLDFDAVPLAEVLAQTNRYSGRKIRLAEPSIGALRVTGAFRPLPVDALADSLAAAFQLTVERSAGGDLVLRRA